MYWYRQSKLDQEYIYFIRSETLPSTFYILSDESSIPFDLTSNGYKNVGARQTLHYGRMWVFPRIRD